LVSTQIKKYLYCIPPCYKKIYFIISEIKKIKKLHGAGIEPTQKWFCMCIFVIYCDLIVPKIVPNSTNFFAILSFFPFIYYLVKGYWVLPVLRPCLRTKTLASDKSATVRRKRNTWTRMNSRTSNCLCTSLKETQTYHKWALSARIWRPALSAYFCFMNCFSTTGLPLYFAEYTEPNDPLPTMLST
jgi:hypothetical protein